MLTSFNKIKERFGKASVSYDSVAKVQREAAAFLVAKLLELPDFSPKAILDLGTGTGCIPELLLSRFSQSSFYLNDIADEMLEVCKAKFSHATNVYYLPGDMLKLNTDIYDCIISNLAMQWLDDLQYALKFFHSKSSDIFAFSTLLDGTFREWKNVLSQYQPIEIMHYPQPEEIIYSCSKLKKQDQTFESWLMDVPLTFDSFIAFMRYLKFLGASSSNNTLHLCNLKKLFQNSHESLTVTYKIFFGIFRNIS